jgi:hypothetical protein
MDKEINDLLYSLPKGEVYSYALNAADLDYEHIPWERVPKLKALLVTADKFLAVEAAKLLTSWANEDGFNFLEDFVCNQVPLNEIWSPHRLRSYDETYAHILSSLVDFWAHKADLGEGDVARKKIFKTITNIIALSNSRAFDVIRLFGLVEREGFTEYLPALKEHLTEILKNPQFHHWKIADCAHLLMKFDPEFVTQALNVYGKTLADYPNK